MKKEIWQCTICNLPRKQVKSYIAEGLYAGFSISRKKQHLILYLKWTQMHWAQLYFTEARFWVIVWGQRETKKKYPTIQSPQMTHFFSACTCWPHHFLSLSLSATDRRLLISFLSFRGGHQGEGEGTRGEETNASSYLFPSPNRPPFSTSPASILYNCVCVWLFRSHQLLIISSKVVAQEIQSRLCNDF